VHPSLGEQAFDPGVERLGSDPLGERRGPVDVREVGGEGARLRVGIEAVDEAGLDTGAQIEEGEGIDRRVEPRGEAGGVLVGLQLHVGQRVAGRLGLQGTDGLAVDEEEVVGEAVPGRHPELADGHAGSGREVHPVAILDDPARGDEGGVDVDAGLLLGGQVHSGPFPARKKRRRGSCGPVPNDLEAVRKSSASESRPGMGCSSNPSPRTERRSSSIRSASARRFAEPTRT